MKASHILRIAAETLEGHQSGRDASNDSSVALAARMFSLLQGVEFSERDAAVFMVLLKLARAARSHNPDNWLDGAAYMAMAGAADESIERKGRE